MLKGTVDLYGHQCGIRSFSFVFHLFFLSWLPVAQYTLVFYKKTPPTYSSKCMGKQQFAEVASKMYKYEEKCYKHIYLSC